MVSSACVESVSGYLQDPASCNTFYGCHRTKERSEGFVRHHYACAGQLRFHPGLRFCTFKTRVPDDMCNSPSSEQTIIGTDKVARREHSVEMKMARTATIDDAVTDIPAVKASYSAYKNTPGSKYVELVTRDHDIHGKLSEGGMPSTAEAITSDETLTSEAEISKITEAISHQLLGDTRDDKETTDHSYMTTTVSKSVSQAPDEGGHQVGTDINTSATYGLAGDTPARDENSSPYDLMRSSETPPHDNGKDAEEEYFKKRISMKSKLIDMVPVIRPGQLSATSGSQSPYNWEAGGDFSSYDMDAVNNQSPFSMGVITE
ncbi:uncharacterized protein LOC125179061 isoform X2 [Hyalella azteca]|nr:uncharacterized protein LOC125179061 isoform X2 [Hyalella azteca]